MTDASEKEVDVTEVAPPHRWISNSGDGGEPVFRRNSHFGIEPVMHAVCSECNARTWFIQAEWEALAAEIPADESAAAPLDLRPITLEEYVMNAITDFPRLQGSVGVRLEALLWKERHPLREFWRQVCFKIRHWRL